MNPSLDNLAALLGRPADQLQVLDHRPLAFAFVPGAFVTYVVRDRASGETLELTLDMATGHTVDPPALRQLDQSQGEARGKKLSPDLLSLVLRHAGLEAVQVRVSFAPDTAQASGGRQLPALLAAELRQLDIELPLQTSGREIGVELTLSVRQIISLGASPGVQSIALAGEPEVPDMV